jgi:hypothetical protein
VVFADNSGKKTIFWGCGYFHSSDAQITDVLRYDTVYLDRYQHFGGPAANIFRIEEWADWEENMVLVVNLSITHITYTYMYNLTLITWRRRQEVPLEMTVLNYQATRRQILEDYNINTHHKENLRRHVFQVAEIINSGHISTNKFSCSRQPSWNYIEGYT